MPIFEMQEPASSPGEERKKIDEDTIVEGELLAVKNKEMPYKDDNGNPVERTEFEFVITDEGFDGRRLWGTTGTKLVDHPDCKLKAWSQEIFGQEFPPGYRLDTDILIGKRARLVVGYREYEKNGEKRWTNSVKDVIRSRTAVGAQSNPF